jgi:hypothetical protein
MGTTGSRAPSRTRRVPIAAARASLRDLVDDVNATPGRIKLTRYDRTIAGLVSAEDLHILEECKLAKAEEERTRAAAPPAAKRPARGRRAG